MAGQGGEETLALIRRRFHVRVIMHSVRPQWFQPPKVVGHAVEDEAMEPIACPAVADTQGLEDHERLLEIIRPLDRTLKAEIPGRAAKGDHPVEDEVPVDPDRSFIAGLHADCRNAGHWSSPPSPRV